MLLLWSSLPKASGASLRVRGRVCSRSLDCKCFQFLGLKTPASFSEKVFPWPIFLAHCWSLVLFLLCGETCSDILRVQSLPLFPQGTENLIRIKDKVEPPGAPRTASGRVSFRAQLWIQGPESRMLSLCVIWAFWGVQETVLWGWKACWRVLL